MTLIFMLVVYVQCRRNINLGPLGPKTSLREKLISLKSVWGVVVLFLLVVGGMYFGIFTSTEAGAVGAFGALIFAIGKRKMTRGNFINSLVETGKITAMIFLIVLGAWIFGYFMTVSQLPAIMAGFISGLAVPRVVILIGILILYLILGSLMEIISMMILTLPLIFPTVIALGYNPIWFGVIMVIMIEMGEVTPPVGINVFVIAGVARDVPMSTIFRGVIPFVIGMAICIAILIAVPQIVTFLPQLLN